MRLLSLLWPQGVNETDLTPMVNHGISDDVIFIDLLLSLSGRPDYHFDSEPTQQNMSSSETESTASDLSQEQELGEVGEGGEVDEGPNLQPYQFEN
jgi:hypothetical protein